MNGSLDNSPDARTVRRLRQVMAVFMGLLVASTWPLWTPGTEFPDIPWFESCCDIPRDPTEPLLIGCLIAFLLLQFFTVRPRWLHAGLSFVLGVLATSMLLYDQHRLQPWVWQMLVGALIIGLSTSERVTLRCFRAFTISIYAWSAVSKLDWAFLEGHGQVLLQGLTESVGLSTAMWSEAAWRALAAVFPVGEAVVALLLALPKLRQVGVRAAITMHALLILTLGPWGLGHEWGAVIWNVFFAVLVWLLFGGRQGAALTEGNKQESSGAAKPQAWIVTALTWTVCMLPALSLVGLWDWWPSWAVYSSRPAVVQMFVDEREIDRLPASLRPHVGTPQPLSTWCPVNLDAWSYDTCWCPMYPQERYRLAVIAAIAGESEIEPHVVILSSPNRWTAERSEEELTAAELRSRLERFGINTSPRETLQRPIRD